MNGGQLFVLIYALFEQISPSGENLNWSSCKLGSSLTYMIRLLWQLGVAFLGPKHAASSPALSTLLVSPLISPPPAIKFNTHAIHYSCILSGAWMVCSPAKINHVTIFLKLNTSEIVQIIATPQIISGNVIRQPAVH